MAITHPKEAMLDCRKCRDITEHELRGSSYRCLDCQNVRELPRDHHVSTGDQYARTRAQRELRKSLSVRYGYASRKEPRHGIGPL